MEKTYGNHKGQQQRSATSFSDLLGDRKDSAASRSGVFPIVFTTPPSSTATKGIDSSRSVDRSRNSSSGARNQTDHIQGSNTQRIEEAPSHFGLSVYYGAQDSYVHSPPSRVPENTNYYSGDSSHEERSWWQGMLVRSTTEPLSSGIRKRHALCNGDALPSWRRCINNSGLDKKPSSSEYTQVLGFVSGYVNGRLAVVGKMKQMKNTWQETHKKWVAPS